MAKSRGFVAGMAVGLALGAIFHVAAVGAQEESGEGRGKVQARSGDIPPVSGKYLQSQGFWNVASSDSWEQYVGELVFEDPTGQPWILCTAHFNCDKKHENCRLQ